MLFVGPMGHGANGLIMDNRGEPVWMEPTGSGVTDLRVQVFEGEAVLSYWTGTGTGGHGEGKGIIKDTRYRTYRSPWTARPDNVPDLAAVPGNGSTMQLYTSWNGATEVAKWRFLTGTGPGSMSEAVTVPRRGFETSTAVAAAPRAAVAALDKSGNVLATSAVIATA